MAKSNTPINMPPKPERPTPNAAQGRTPAPAPLPFPLSMKDANGRVFTSLQLADTPIRPGAAPFRPVTKVDESNWTFAS